ncbi:MAG TPA: RIP metalloprotease RseP [Chthoniobacterales bacterium]
MPILRFLFVCLEVVLLFNLMILVHELGHFLAARWRGLVVEKFGIWFGKPIWKKTIGGVEYSLGSIPAGGFVALPQMAPMEVMEGRTDTPREMLPPISALDKIIVAIAGPLFSVLLAVIFAFVVWGVGRPVAEGEKTTRIGYVELNSPADKAGLRPGDKILSVNGKPVERFGGMDKSVSWNVISSEGNTIPFVVERDGQKLTLTSTFEKEKKEFWERKGFRQVGISPAQTPLIAKIIDGSFAARAGFKPNDFITAVDGQKIYSPEGIDLYLEQNPKTTVQLTVQRGHETLQLPLTIDGLPVAGVVNNGPAEVAGIRAGDVITAINGKPAVSRTSLSKSVRNSPGQIITFTIRRGTETRDVKLKPARPDSPKSFTDPVVGVQWQPDALGGITWDLSGRLQIAHPTPWEQIKAASTTLFNTLGAVLSPKSDVGLQHLSGPAGIGRIYYILLQNEYGWQAALWFSVVLNINLAIMNMLPIPVLDGGHITLALVEAARKRPVNVRILERIQSACAFLIIGFMLYVTFFDAQDFFGRRTIKFERPVPAVTQ